MPTPLKPSLRPQVSEPVCQYELFGETKREAVVNVASVPQRSPFRYPGGKTWLVPRLRRWLRSLPESRRSQLIEPFTGGGIVSLTAAFENLTPQVTMVELDGDVAAVWQTILSGDAAWLAEKIASFSLTPECVQSALERTPQSTPERAFQTLLRNRVNHGGILAPGCGKIKHGENGKGIASRWYPQTLRARILNIAAIAPKIRFVHGDGIAVMRENADRTGTVFFLDPPYTAAGKRAGARLYAHNELDHEELFQTARRVAGDFLMTYDNAEGVRRLAERHGFVSLPIPMKNTHHAEMTELLIGRDLSWA